MRGIGFRSRVGVCAAGFMSSMGGDISRNLSALCRLFSGDLPSNTLIIFIYQVPNIKDVQVTPYDTDDETIDAGCPLTHGE